MPQMRSDVVPADPLHIARAAALLRNGALVAFPTETVYGLGADATDDRAVAGIFEAKGRPRFNPLIVHVPDAHRARALVQFTPLAEQLGTMFWPGPLTLVLPRRPACPLSLLVSAGLETVAVRVPAHPVAQQLLGALDRPIAAPSANRSGRISPTAAEHVLDGMKGKVGLVLDGGVSTAGVESTVIGFADETPLLLRPGAVAREEIEAITGPLNSPPGGSAIASPGQLASHYAPRAALRLNATDAEEGEAVLAFGAHNITGARTLNLSAAGDLKEAAANLFAMLRALDASGAERIAVMPIPQHGLGEAINDRLRRAAAPRGAFDDH